MSNGENTINQKLHLIVLQGLMLLGFMFHNAEDWSDRPTTFLVFGTIAIFLFVKKLQQWAFLLFLGISIVIYAQKFPNLANHSNLNFFVFLVLFPFQLLFCLNRKVNIKDLISTFRLTILILYFFTIFHKLNWDFINPETSCANQKLSDYLALIPPQWTQVSYWAVVINPYMGLIVEGLIPVCLFFSRLRVFGIFFVVILHFILAPMGFTDFSSLAMGFAWTFVDPEKLDIKNLWKHFVWLASFCIFMELCFAPGRYVNANESHEVLEGALFAWAYTPFLWVYYRKNIDTTTLQIPLNWAYRFALIFLFFFGFNNYLGLRTAGNFTMFSNLVTEGKTSNHMLLGSNPFKIWGYQEDVVFIEDVSIEYEGTYKHMPAPGQRIPRVEFQRILEFFRDRGWRNVEMQVTHRGEYSETKSAGYDANFNFDVNYWEKKLLKFRLIQAKRPQYCHW